jgi:hypothetical protein
LCRAYRDRLKLKREVAPAGSRHRDRRTYGTPFNYLIDKSLTDVMIKISGMYISEVVDREHLIADEFQLQTNMSAL